MRARSSKGNTKEALWFKDCCEPEFGGTGSTRTVAEWAAITSCRPIREHLRRAQIVIALI